MIHDDRPAHHTPGGGFRIPWLAPGEDRRGGTDFLRWMWQRMTTPLPPDPHPERLPAEAPDPARPRASSGEIRATWVGHATFLLQVGPLNVLTDPMWSRRASPVGFAGPARFLPPGLGLDDLPPVDAVLLSHDHFDHLDEPSVVALRDLAPDARWITPLGYRRWFRRRGITRLVELDWWESCRVQGPAGAVDVTLAPAQHWTRRRVAVNRRLWGSFAVRGEAGESVYFGADSGYFEGYTEIGRRLGPFDLVLLPIGAYEPRWFMRLAHMNPEEAVQAYRDLGGRGLCAGMHWGTFRLTDEDPLEPPERLRQAWRRAELPPELVRVPGIGGTLTLVSSGSRRRGRG